MHCLNGGAVLRETDMLTQEAASRKDRTTGQNVELQHRHFAFIAATIKGMRVLSRRDRETVAKQFSEACALSNPRFDRDRFMTACGL